MNTKWELARILFEGEITNVESAHDSYEGVITSIERVPRPEACASGPAWKITMDLCGESYGQTVTVTVTTED